MKLHLVTAQAALAWAYGTITDDLLKAQVGHTAVFWEWLDEKTEWEEACKFIVAAADAGAVTLVARTIVPAVERKIAKHGGMLMSRDNPPFDPQGRWIVLPEGFKAWVEKVR